jgi:hypothetical protein
MTAIAPTAVASAATRPPANAGRRVVGLLAAGLGEERARQQAEHPRQHRARRAEVEADADGQQQQAEPRRPEPEVVDADVR